MVSPSEPRPLTPLARLAPKWPSSASTPPDTGDSASRDAATRSLTPIRSLLTVLRFRPVAWAIRVAFRSTPNSLANCLNFASEIFERRTHLFFAAVTGFQPPSGLTS
jgi:hypothetical protein